ncbi:MAG: PAS domain S-box protein [Verrucomicrobia bacterium]|nr:PAS domain S-box protein [Verrucomicrobiota bacterium]
MASDDSKNLDKLADDTGNLRTVLDTATDAILITGPERRITAWNDHFLEIWGVRNGELASRDFQRILGCISKKLRDPARYLARITEIEAARENTYDLLELAERIWVEQYSRPSLLDDRTIGRVWCFRNVTERHQSDLLSRRLAAIVDSSDDAIVGKNLDSIITSWNQGAERIFGYSAEEMIGKSIRTIIPPDRQEEEDEILARLRRGERYEHFETVRVTKDGRKLDVSLTISPIKDANGRIIGASKIARDITAWKATVGALIDAKKIAEAATSRQRELLEREKAAREESEKANRLKDEFLATLGHELRTPLNAMLGWAAVLRAGKVKPEEIVNGMEAIERNARVQAQIIDDLLDMSRIMSGKVRLEVERLDLASIMDEAVQTVLASASAKGVRLQADSSAAELTVSGDPNRLRQVFWNLLSNAIKFTPKGGRVQVILKRVNSKIEVRVVDTGEGISAEFLPSIFNRFEQADASTTRRHGGLGLGLSIVKQLVELHGGMVRAESEGIGKGATFVVSLPLAPLTAIPKQRGREYLHAEHTEIRALPELSLKDVRVLVVDDDLDSRILIKSLLESARATVYLAESAKNALEFLQKDSAEVLVCDIGMPEIDGYTLMRRIRMLDDAQKSEIPGVALTAYARPADRREAIRAGFQNHVSKPVEPAELLEIVYSLANRRSRRHSADGS